MRTDEIHADPPSGVTLARACCALPESPLAGNLSPGKVALDAAVSVGLLVAAAIPMAVIALLVKLTSRGPVIYSQTRLGHGGRPFRIYKFRTMWHECERHSGPRWSRRGDPRVTPLGRFLRLSHLDELPQLWNVVKGDMSLVGPRPERPEFIPTLELSIPRYRERLQVLPGVTGLAQVQLPPDTDMASVRRKLAYDLYYVERRTLWLDVRLIASTALVMFFVPSWIAWRLLRIPGPPKVENKPPYPPPHTATIAKVETLPG
jgi:lipopolysaccharide/colanic/teichoic acid biosynthesis glycosyltransferase